MKTMGSILRKEYREGCYISGCADLGKSCFQTVAYLTMSVCK
jgi:hypothetical protein